MVKLKKFKERKLTNKNIMISFVIMMLFMIALVMSKSYAIYKMQKEFDVIKSQIGTFTNGDVKVAVLVDGKETNEFPSYETNYKIESVECTNGVTGSFDVENWQVTIADMKATSTKCTVSFNSNETNEITPINMSKKDLIALNETLTDTFKTNLKKEILNETYPVGSIYMSTEDDTIEKVQNKFGGTWVRYAEGRTLIGVGTGTDDNKSSKNFLINTTGGEYSHKLSIAELASHYHRIGVVSDNGVAANNVWLAPQNNELGTWSLGWTDRGASPVYGVNESNKAGGYTQTVGGNESHNNISPYIALYMYKRTA